MIRTQHAFAARALIHACGGVDACVTICRLGKTKLYAAMEPGEPVRPECQDQPPPAAQVGEGPTGYYLPADVIDALEAYCGEPIYAATLLSARPARTEHRGLRREARQLLQATVAVLDEVPVGDGEDFLPVRLDGRLAEVEQAVSRCRVAAKAGVL